MRYVSVPFLVRSTSGIFLFGPCTHVLYVDHATFRFHHSIRLRLFLILTFTQRFRVWFLSFLVLVLRSFHLPGLEFRCSLLMVPGRCSISCSLLEIVPHVDLIPTTHVRFVTLTILDATLLFVGSLLLVRLRSLPPRSSFTIVPHVSDALRLRSGFTIVRFVPRVHVHVLVPRHTDFSFR